LHQSYSEEKLQNFTFAMNRCNYSRHL